MPEMPEEEAMEEALELLEARVAIKTVVNKLESLLDNLEVKTCVSCSGTGRYDSKNSPHCGSCDGTGKELDYDTENEIRSLVSSAYDLSIDLGSEVDEMVTEKLARIRA